MVDSSIAEYRKVVDGVYGTFLDAAEGFRQVCSKMAQIEDECAQSFEELKKKRPDLAHLSQGGAEFSYSRLVPAGSPLRHRHLHQAPTEIIKQRNLEGGDNFRLIGNMCVITLYQYWDEKYRSAFAYESGVEKNQIRVPLFGDLRHYRHAIIHNGGIATTDVENCTILKWFKRGQTILVDRNKFEEVIDNIFEFLGSFQQSPEKYINRLHLDDMAGSGE